MKSAAKNNYLYDLSDYSSRRTYPWCLSPDFSRPTVGGMFHMTWGYVSWINSWSAGGGLFPVINLKPDIAFMTDGQGEPGTVNNPYIIK